MKNKYLIFALLLILAYPLSAFAISSPLVDEPPSSVDANAYTFTVYTEQGATVLVVGGTADIAPVTDGAGDDLEDGRVRVKVGLAQNKLNSFSIVAKKDGASSEATVVEINEMSSGSSGSQVPDIPVLDEIPEVVNTSEYTIRGMAEPEVIINVKNTLGELVAETTSNTAGFFEVLVDLEENVTNRFNVSAEYEIGIEGQAVQAVIRQLTEGGDEEGGEGSSGSDGPVFNDIAGHWAESFINQLYRMGVVSGKSEGIFDPNGLVSRSELTKIAILAFDHSVADSVDIAPFPDVPQDLWSAPFVHKAKELGFVEGFPSGDFGPDNFVTRAAALKIILGAAKIDVSDVDPDFPDVPEDVWYKEYVGFAQENDVVSGYEDGMFRPANNMTRAQVAKVVIKVMELKGELASESQNEGGQGIAVGEMDNVFIAVGNPDFKLPADVDSAQLVKFFKKGDNYYATVMRPTPNVDLKGLSSDFAPAFVGVLKGDQVTGEWEKYLSVNDANDAAVDNAGNNPYYMWEYDGSLLISVVDAVSMTEGGGLMKLLRSDDHGESFFLAGCYLFGDNYDASEDGDYYAYSSRLSAQSERALESCKGEVEWEML